MFSNGRVAFVDIKCESVNHPAAHWFPAFPGGCVIVVRDEIHAKAVSGVRKIHAKRSGALATPADATSI